MHDSKRTEHCPDCALQGERVFSSKIHFKGTNVENAEYNPAFGKVIHNKRERRYEAEKRGWQEVGSDYKSGDSMQNKFEKDRLEKNEKSWKEL